MFSHQRSGGTSVLSDLAATTDAACPILWLLRITFVTTTNSSCGTLRILRGEWNTQGMNDQNASSGNTLLRIGSPNISSHFSFHVHCQYAAMQAADRMCQCIKYMHPTSSAKGAREFSSINTSNLSTAIKIEHFKNCVFFSVRTIISSHSRQDVFYSPTKPKQKSGPPH